MTDAPAYPHDELRLAQALSRHRAEQAVAGELDLPADDGLVGVVIDVRHHLTLARAQGAPLPRQLSIVQAIFASHRRSLPVLPSLHKSADEMQRLVDGAERDGCREYLAEHYKRERMRQQEREALTLEAQRVERMVTALDLAEREARAGLSPANFLSDAADAGAPEAELERIRGIAAEREQERREHQAAIERGRHKHSQRIAEAKVRLVEAQAQRARCLAAGDVDGAREAKQAVAQAEADVRAAQGEPIVESWPRAEPKAAE